MVKDDALDEVEESTKLINDLENHNSIKNTEADENNSRVLEISTR